MGDTADDARDDIDQSKGKIFIPISGIIKIMIWAWKSLFKKKKVLFIPLFFFASTAYAIPGPEFCGDMVDNTGTYTPPCPNGYQTSFNGLGCDKLCPKPDADNDGYNDIAFGGFDCDDANSQIYPGISVACTVTNPNDGWKKCGANGQWTSCTLNSSSPLAEGVRNFYFDFQNGNNNNSCTFTSPCKDWLKFAYFSNSSDPEKPAVTITPTPGDYFYFKGTAPYTTTYTVDGFGTQAWMMRDFNGTSNAHIVYKAYPGPRPILNGAGCDSVTQCASFYWLDSDWSEIEGFDIRNSYGAGGLYHSDNMFVRNMVVHDIHGNEDNNDSCYYVSGTNVSIKNSIGYDCHEIGPGAQNDYTDQNDRIAVGFGAQNLEIAYTTMFYTAGKNSTTDTGQCYTHKHASPNLSDPGGANIHHNSMWGCKLALGSGQKATKFYRNRIGDVSEAFKFTDFGGTTWVNSEEVYNNTVINAGSFLGFVPYDAVTLSPTITIHDNVYLTDTAWTFVDQGAYVICNYCGSALYTPTRSVFSSNNNCFRSTATTAGQFNLFATNGGGAVYNFTGWQGQGFDANSYNESFGPDAYYRATSTNCANKGAMLLSEEQTSSGGGGGPPTGGHNFDPSKAKWIDRRLQQ